MVSCKFTDRNSSGWLLARWPFIFDKLRLAMNKRAIDLSLEELAAMGANAALKAANDARDADLAVTGVAEVRQGDRVTQAIVQRRPSGIVTRLDWDRADNAGAVSVPVITKRVDD